MKTSTNQAIRIIGEERAIRALIRKAVREGIAVARGEERAIEDAFLRLAFNRRETSPR